MAQNQQMQTSASSVQSQPSGTLEQEEIHVDIPFGLRTPNKDEGRKSLTGNHNQEPAAASGALEYSGHQTLADRIKSRSRRSASHSSSQVPSAAVHALAETIDAAIAPNTGASERYLDSRDADHNVPEDIPGASEEQVQHREQPVRTSQAANGGVEPATNDDRQQGPATPAQVKPKRPRKGSKAALLRTAAELAQSPDVSEDILQEDEQVTKRRRSRKQLQVDNETGAALNAALDEDGFHPGTTAAKKSRQQMTKTEATHGDVAAAEAAVAALDTAEEQQPAAVVVAEKSGGRKRQAATSATAVEAVKAAVAAVTDTGTNKAPKRQRIKATEMAVKTETELVEPAEKGKKPRNRKKKEVEAVETDITVEGTEEGAEIKVTKKRRRANAENMKPQFEMPTRDVLDKALQWTPTPRPVPNLGYACLCMDLREQKPPIFTNRDMVQKTFKAKGLPYVSELALENVKALKALVQWNHEHGIRFFRMTSNMLPWCTFYNMEELVDFPVIAEELAFAGKLARAYQQRLTFHPSHFVKVAAPEAQPDLLQRSLKELEVHSQILDLMGYEPSNWNKVNIHIGGVYGDKESTLERFAVNFQQLSDNCKKRLTLENDDWGSAFSVRDLLPLSRKCNIPIVFDFHHHKFCTGGWTEKQAFYAALETWPKGVRPAVHWSESQEERRPSAHSDYIQGPMNLHGKERDVDVMIEAKCKERTLLRFRDETMLKQDLSAGLAVVKQEPSAGFAVVKQDPSAELAMQFI